MSTIEIRQELHDLINSADDKILKKFYKIAVAYLEQTDRDPTGEGEDGKDALETYSNKEESEIQISPLVESLTGVLEGDPDYKNEYRAYLKKKYL